jgi:hypothetical protein
MLQEIKNDLGMKKVHFSLIIKECLPGILSAHNIQYAWERNSKQGHILLCGPFIHVGGDIFMA